MKVSDESLASGDRCWGGLDIPRVMRYTDACRMLCLSMEPKRVVGIVGSTGSYFYLSTPGVRIGAMSVSSNIPPLL